MLYTGLVIVLRPCGLASMITRLQHNQFPLCVKWGIPATSQLCTPQRTCSVAWRIGHSPSHSCTVRIHSYFVHATVPAVICFGTSLPCRSWRQNILSLCKNYLSSFFLTDVRECSSVIIFLTHWGQVTQICVFNTRLFSLQNTLNYAIHRACLRMVLLTDVYRNLTSLWINL